MLATAVKRGGGFGVDGGWGVGKEEAKVAEAHKKGKRDSYP